MITMTKERAELSIVANTYTASGLGSLLCFWYNIITSFSSVKLLSLFSFHLMQTSYSKCYLAFKS